MCKIEKTGLTSELILSVSMISEETEDLAKQFMENSAHRPEGNKNRTGQGGDLMAQFPAREPTLQVFKNRFDMAGPGWQRLSLGQTHFLKAGTRHERLV